MWSRGRLQNLRLSEAQRAETKIIGIDDAVLELGVDNSTMIYGNTLRIFKSRKIGSDSYIISSNMAKMNDLS